MQIAVEERREEEEEDYRGEIRLGDNLNFGRRKGCSKTFIKPYTFSNGKHHEE